MRVDGERRAGGISDGFIADPEVEDRVFDVELDGRLLTFELDDLMRGGERIDSCFEEIVGRIAIQIAVSLGQGDEFRSAAVGVKDEGAVAFGQAEVFCDLRCQGGAICLLLEEFGIDGGSVSDRRDCWDRASAC